MYSIDQSVGMPTNQVTDLTLTGLLEYVYIIIDQAYQLLQALCESHSFLIYVSQGFYSTKPLIPQKFL